MKMDISVEISMYPLKDDYKTPIIAFISALKQQAGITVVENSMSTQVFGEYESVMEAINHCTRQSFDLYPALVLVYKIVSTDTRKLGANHGE